LRKSAAVAKLDEHFALPLERTDGRALPAKPNPDQGMEVTFNDVSFAYGRGEAGIKNLSFKIGAGEFVGIVGPSGGGKSTIFDLLIGLYEPDSGQILLDGAEMQELSLAALRAEIGVVPQDTFLWNASLIENLTYPKSQPGWVPKWSVWFTPRSCNRLLRRCQTACKPWSASAAWRFPAVNANGWRLPGHSCGSHGCCCWMRPLRRLIR
jgi:ABC-type siderophore export system fused ATPase/permease subunit